MKKSVVKRVPANKAQYREVAPNASRTISALREMGYDSFAAVMDLVDNALDAGATRVAISIRELSGRVGVIDILDDGKGMDEKTLAEALRLGSDTEHDEKKDLGKFGMGLVTASISLARNVWVLSRKDGGTANEATFDLDTVDQQNKFVIELHPASSHMVMKEIDQPHGTLVRLSKIDRISDGNYARFASTLRQKVGQVYRHFLQQGVKISVNNRLALATDPLMLDHPQTEVVLDTEFNLGDGTTAKLKIVELPELGTQGDADAGIFPHNSGFYVVRNRREIIAGETFGFYRHHHSYSHFRAELSYTGDSKVFHEDVKKASIFPDDRLLGRLKDVAQRYWEQSGRRGKERAESAPLHLPNTVTRANINAALAVLSGVPQVAQQIVEEAPRKRGRPTKEEAEQRAAEEAERQKALDSVPTVEFGEKDTGDTGRFFQAEHHKDGKLVITYNSRHPFVRMVADSKQRMAAAVMDLVAFSMAKAEAEVPEGKKLVNKACDYLKLAAAPQEGANAK